MQFTSLAFLAFFAAVFAAYWLSPPRWRWLCALCASGLFYGLFGLRMLLVLALCVAGSYAGGRALARAKKKRWALGVAMALALAPLLFFKYGAVTLGAMDFASGAAGALPLLARWSLLAPVGVSFFTFKIIAYLVEVWRGALEAERHFGRYALYVSFFPQVTSGPIQRPAELLGQIRAPRAFVTRRGIEGAQLLLWGFFKKLVLADNLAGYVSVGFQSPDTLLGPSVLLAAVGYSIQLYCDFSGYSDLAIGCMLLLGYDVPPNFQSPYFATSIRDFWARWHISLSSFLRDYVYFPLGGSRCGTARTCVNLLLTFFISGLWHGTGLVFIVWGLLHGAYQVAGRLTRGARAKLWRLCRLREDGALALAVKMLVTFALVSFAWLFFGSQSLDAALHMLARIPQGFSLAPQVWKNAAAMLGVSGAMALRLGAALLLLAGVDFAARTRGFSAWLSGKKAWRQAALCYVLAAFILFVGAPGSGAFLYFQF